jgi:hypothetical protein
MAKLLIEIRHYQNNVFTPAFHQKKQHEASKKTNKVGFKTCKYKQFSREDLGFVI